MSSESAKVDRINSGMYSSNTDEWGTPCEFFDLLDAEFHFTLDVCASDLNAKCPTYLTKADDALRVRWDGVCWMNPPYGRGIDRWMCKAYEESLSGATVVCLIPARTDTAYWHQYVMLADEIRFVRGRLHFDGGHERGGHNAPFPSAVVVFRPPSTTPTVLSMGRTQAEHASLNHQMTLADAAAAARGEGTDG